MIRDLQTFVPARDFDLSRRFYRELGFTENFVNADVAQFEVGGFRFLLQNFHVAEWAGNFMMQLLCDDVEPWWRKIVEQRLVERYPGIMLKAPAIQPWGLRVMYLSDPSGVLWHFAEHQRTVFDPGALDVTGPA